MYIFCLEGTDSTLSQSSVSVISVMLHPISIRFQSENMSVIENSLIKGDGSLGITNVDITMLSMLVWHCLTLSLTSAPVRPTLAGAINRYGTHFYVSWTLVVISEHVQIHIAR